jgi:hypothetical protein
MTYPSSQGWHSRALQAPYPNPHSFTPTPESLILTILLNTKVEPQGVTVAFFEEPQTEQTIVVDTLGRVSFVASTDIQDILSLAKGAAVLPDTGTWHNTWVIKQPATSQPIHRIFVPAQDQDSTARSLTNLKQISVQGFSKTTRELKDPVNGYHELPVELWELTGLLLEASEGGEPRDGFVLDRVRSVVDPLF